MNNNVSGLVIGKLGETIRQLQEETHASLRAVAKDTYPVCSAERLFYITGTKSQVIDCVTRMLQRVQSAPVIKRAPVPIPTISI